MRFLHENGSAYIQNENTLNSTHIISNTDYSIIFFTFNITKLTGTLVFTTQFDDIDNENQPTINVKLSYEDNEKTFDIRYGETISILATDIDSIYCKSEDSSTPAYIKMEYLYDYLIDCGSLCQ